MVRTGNFETRYNELTRRILKHTAGGGKTENAAFSPLSILILLLMLADAAGGSTRKEIEEALQPGVPYEKTRAAVLKLYRKVTGGRALNSANAVCVKKELADSILPGYLAALKKDLDGEFIASSDIIGDVNRWVCGKTNGMITEIADESMSGMMLALMNAVAFEAEWEIPYNEYDLCKKIFTNADGKRTKADMLCSFEERYIEDDTFTGFVKPYREAGFSFMALLPKEEGTAAMRKALEGADPAGLYAQAQSCEVQVTMPEFECIFEAELQEFCMEMGIREIFSEKADLTPMSDVPLTVERIIHKCRIEVDRKGTRAAAASAAFMELGCLPPEPLREVILDRPFLYAVMCGGIPVFAGVLNRI